MAIMNSRAISGRAAALLPEPPATLEVLADTGGTLRIQLLSRNGLEYQARAPKLRVQPRISLRARVDAVEGGGHDVELLVASVQAESKWTAIVRLQVTAVHERSARRAAQRLRVGESAPLYAMACRAVRAGEQFDVEVADLSTAGVAFVSDRVFHTGDLVALMPRVDGQEMRMRARVLHTDRMDDGQTRVGCELAAITPANRQRIARLAGGLTEPAADVAQ
jgi:PilZ domain